MAKKDKTPPPSGALTHSPFAGLSSLQGAQLPAQPAPAPASAVAPARAKTRGRLVQRRETKHRAGKAVIVISGFAQLRDFDAAAVAQLARELKQALGCGGSVDEHAGAPEIVLQGDRPAQVAELLRARGFRVDGVTG